MKHAPQSPLPSTAHMVDYDRYSHMQDQAIRSKAEHLRELVARIGPVRPEFVVMDYGCGPGHSAIDSVQPVIDAYRKLDPNGAVVVRHADQAGNDWNALVSIIMGCDGYELNKSKIRTEAVIGSFYTQLAAPGSVSLGVCFAASHWLSRALTVSSPKTVWFADLEGEARTTFASFALADWTLFLRQRARELRPGGYMMVSTLGSVPDATEKNGVRASATKLYRALFKVAEQMVREELLSSPALESFVFPLWFPTAQDARQPVEEEPDLARAFEIVEVSVSPAEFHPVDVYQDKLNEPETYAKLYRGYVQGFAESTLRLHLFNPSASNYYDADYLCAEFFRRFEELYKTQPGLYASETMIMTLVLRRR